LIVKVKIVSSRCLYFLPKIGDYQFKSCLLCEILSRGLQEEVIGSKENSPPQPDVEEYTYNSIVGTIFMN
jgi:hypothetical protein